MYLCANESIGSMCLNKGCVRVGKVAGARFRLWSLGRFMAVPKEDRYELGGRDRVVKERDFLVVRPSRSKGRDRVVKEKPA